MAPRDKVANYCTKSMFVSTTTTNAFSGNYHPFVDEITTKEFVSFGLIISNDGADWVDVSFNGTDVHGRIKAGEVLTFTHRREQEIWLKSASGGVAFRLWVW